MVSRFPTARGIDEVLNRAQDNVATALNPVLDALQKTPIMGAKPAWTQVDFQNSYGNFNPNYQPVAYQKDALGYVHLRGCASRSVAGFANITVFILPAGFRPALNLVFSTYGNGRFTSLLIRNNGSVELEVSDSATPELLVSFEGITFLGEQ